MYERVQTAEIATFCTVLALSSRPDQSIKEQTQWSLCLARKLNMPVLGKGRINGTFYHDIAENVENGVSKNVK